jgi:hypothetical protein
VRGASREAGAAARLRRKLTGEFGIGRLSAHAAEEGVEIRAHAKSLNVDIASKAAVRDGLAFLANRMDQWTASSCRILALNMLKASGTRNLTLPDEQRARIRQAGVIAHPRTRLIHPVIPSPAIRTEARGSISPPAITNEGMTISSRLGNRIPISQISALPHACKSIDIHRLPAADYEGFLREAEIIKGLLPGQCELRAVFRHVPIELISQMRFMAERNVIVYRVSESRRLRTRVHDMAAVRDNVTQEIHLVPHRTRFRWASLN